jgi:hypothetical protein
MTAPITDILGNQLDVGDEVAVAFPNGRSSAELRVGEIISFTEKERDIWNPSLRAWFPGPPIIQIEIKWDKDRSAGYSVPEKPTKLKDHQGRMVKIN